MLIEEDAANLLKTGQDGKITLNGFIKCYSSNCKSKQLLQDGPAMNNIFRILVTAPYR